MVIYKKSKKNLAIKEKNIIYNIFHVNPFNYGGIKHVQPFRYILLHGGIKIFPSRKNLNKLNHTVLHQVLSTLIGQYFTNG